MSEPVLEEIFVTTKEECQREIDKANRVCDRCGGKREPIKTVDNANNPTYWAGCNHCSRFTGGVDLIIYKTAKRMVDIVGYFCYDKFINEEKASYEEIEYWRESQIAGACNMVRDVLRMYELSKSGA